MQKRTRSLIIPELAISACVSELPADAPSEIKLIPAGAFRARDGRPHGVAAWQMDSTAAAKIIASSEQAVGDFVVDYEHQTLKAETNGQPAPAAAWFKKLEWREGDGLYATDVRWTNRAEAAIAAKEYRYISPVFQWDRKTGHVRSVLMAALTNYPAIDGHSDLVARAAAKFHLATQEDTQMDRDQLIALLGLATDATDTQITEALTALKTRADQADSLQGEVEALKAKPATGNPDPSKFVPVETVEALKQDIAALRATQTSTEVDGLIKSGLADGKLLPQQETWARDLGNSDVTALKAYLEKTPAIAALKGTQTGGKAPQGGEDDEQLTDDQLAICKATGISVEDFKKSNVQEVSQ